MPEPQLQYVVLRHEGITDPHFDLMIEPEPGAPLWTWRVETWPLCDGQRLVRIADHRRSYLEYEGPISGNRGFVKRVGGGRVRMMVEGSMPQRIHVEGIDEPAPQFTLQQDCRTDQWVVRLSAGE